jgi:hypothetical protein
MTILGPDLIINGGFDTDTDWIKGDGISIAAGVASWSGAQAANSAVEQDVGISTTPTLYKVTWDLVSRSAGNATPRIRPSGETGEAQTVPGSYIDYLWSYSGTNGRIGIRGTDDFIGSVDNVTCQVVFNSFSNQKRDFRNKILQWGI